MVQGAAELAAGRAGRPIRVLLYSHDTFGLGHLRRTRALATAITRANPSASALIVTGSPVAGRFAFPRQVDHVRLPGVVKQPDGDYVSKSLHLGINETTALRGALIEAAVSEFDPDLVIVDKEPTGFRGEMLKALKKLRDRRRARVVLGVRDVMDDPESLREEWRRKGAAAAVESFYDETWVYGLRDIYDPLAGISLSRRTRNKTVYTGYLRRELYADMDPPAVEPPFILVTPGGGGDGAALIDWALSAYECDPTLPRAVFVYGPFLNSETRAAFDARAEAIGDRITAFGFVSAMEQLMAQSEGVVAMGGYNTFCEILSMDRPALIAPRTTPRLEQFIRAEAAERLGLVRMIDRERDGTTPEVMANAIHALEVQSPPSAQSVPGVLDGFDRIVDRTMALLDLPARTRRQPERAVAG